MIISQEKLEKYKKEFDSRMMTSAVWEYCPEEFGDLLEYIKTLETFLDRCNVDELINWREKIK